MAVALMSIRGTSTHRFTALIADFMVTPITLLRNVCGRTALIAIGQAREVTYSPFVIGREALSQNSWPAFLKSSEKRKTPPPGGIAGNAGVFSRHAAGHQPPCGAPEFGNSP